MLSFRGLFRQKYNSKSSKELHTEFFKGILTKIDDSNDLV